MNEEDIFKKRIGFKGTLSDIGIEICKEYSFGIYVSSELAKIGYEDFNFSLCTTKGKFFVKVFASFRSLADCKGYCGRIESALKQGVQTPKIIKSKKGLVNTVSVNGKKLRLVVMDFIEGKSLFDSKSNLTESEVKSLAKQAARISLIKTKPRFVYDSWSIDNFAREFKKKRKFLPKRDLELIEPIVEEFCALKTNKLPRAFVHGDLIKTNIIKDEGGKLWLIDFSVSNYSPRINELAILCCNSFFVPTSKAKTKKNIVIALSEYQKIVSLTKRELTALPVLIKVAYSIYVLMPLFAKHKGNKTKENEYWLKQGRAGLYQKW
ncbi:MAG: phosphotransferase [archaeon]|jgi:Ser/Thr protein kinase RdoA (MazF antagonist)